jgi:hypothetical protein
MGRLRVRYADVAATVALILALGGSAYAAGIVPAGSVHSAQLARGAVSQPKLAFPLGLASKEVESFSAQGYTCPPGAPCPAELPEPITTLALHVAQAGLVAMRVSGAVESPTGTAAAVGLGVEKAQRFDTWLTSVDAPNGGTIPLSGEVVLPVRAGTEHFTLTATPGTAGIRLFHVRITAMVMPALK